MPAVSFQGEQEVILTNRGRSSDIRYHRIVNARALGSNSDFTIFPAMQELLNGRQRLNYGAEDEGTTPKGIVAPMKRVFLAGHACDPT